MTQWLRLVARLTPTSMPWWATPVYHFAWLSRDCGKEQLYKYSPSNLPNIFQQPPGRRRPPQHHHQPGGNSASLGLFSLPNSKVLINKSWLVVVGNSHNLSNANAMCNISVSPLNSPPILQCLNAIDTSHHLPQYSNVYCSVHTLSAGKKVARQEKPEQEKPPPGTAGGGGWPPPRTPSRKQCAGWSARKHI